MSDEITLLAGGDIMLDRQLPLPRLFFQFSGYAACASMGIQQSFPIPYLNNHPSRQFLLSAGVNIEAIIKSSHRFDRTLMVPNASADSTTENPFGGLNELIKDSDILFANLECPLSSRGRRLKNDNCFRAHPELAKFIPNSCTVLSFSNNHCMDYGEVAFEDTLECLKARGVECTGVVYPPHPFQRPVIVERKQIRVAFLAYSQFGPEHAFAMPGELGIAPLNELAVVADIQQIREIADWVIVSAHWGLENSSDVHAEQVMLARRLIDSGADIILGHHAHVPAGIEIYNRKPIFYSLGNLIFGHNHEYWGDNVMASLRLDRNKILSLELIALATAGEHHNRPVLARQERARRTLEGIQSAASRLGSTLILSGNRGLIDLDAGSVDLGSSEHYR